MRKLLVSLLLVLGVAQAGDNEYGVGVSFNSSGDPLVVYSPSGTVVMKEYRFTFEEGIASDYMFVQMELFEPVNFYLGFGFAFPWELDSLVLRIPVGLSIDIEMISSDIFIEAVPSYVVVGDRGYGSSFNTGLRYYF